MSYNSKRGKRPAEYASKASHVHIAKSPSVKEFLGQCILPKSGEEIDLDEHTVVLLEKLVTNPIRHIIAIDGGFTEVPVRADYPSASIAFFQLGALSFKVADLEGLAAQPFIDPVDMSKLKQIDRVDLTLPVRNVALKAEVTLTHSVRRALYDFFAKRLEGGLVTLRWFIFQEYDVPLTEWNLARCPHCQELNVKLQRNQIGPDFGFDCPHCKHRIWLTDVFRLQEAVDDELGAGGILGYVVTSLEQLLLVHVIRLMMKTKMSILREVLFIKDGPLAFFGQTANLHKPMRHLMRYLMDKQSLNLVGLEKSGPFVDHAGEIAGRLKPGQVLLLDNEYIYKYIIPGHADPNNPYGVTTYYGNKVIFMSRDERVYVATLPTRQVVTAPTIVDFGVLDVVLNNVEKLRCDMYDDALFPVALVNKLVSLSDHPSGNILQKLAMQGMGL